MKKKILFGALVLAVAVITAPMFAAFEAHVINVTAKIENALKVNTDDIDFGTVFPQEHLDRPLEIALSASFQEEERVDDVSYIIRQKPKCGVTSDGGETLVGPTATGHVSVDASGNAVIDCGPVPRDLVTGESWGVLPSLCEYISKEADTDVVNDTGMPSFHEPWSIVNEAIVWNDSTGYLSKLDQDIVDNWIIDLAVPCFGGTCGQDWADFVADINPDVDADDYVGDIDDEHKIFGCDLWVEVKEVSETD